MSENTRAMGYNLGQSQEAHKLRATTKVQSHKTHELRATITVHSHKTHELRATT